MVFSIGNNGDNVNRIQQSQQSQRRDGDPPPSIYNNPDGISGREQINYIFSRIEERTGEFNVDFETLADVMVKYDYDMDRNQNSVIEVNEATGYGYDIYMNRDENGQIEDTHVLDMLFNRYMIAINKKDEEPPARKISIDEALASVQQKDQDMYNNAINNSGDAQLIYETYLYFSQKSDDENYGVLCRDIGKFYTQFIDNALEFCEKLPSAEYEVVSKVISGQAENKKDIQNAIDTLNKYSPDDNAVKFLKCWCSGFNAYFE